MDRSSVRAAPSLPSFFAGLVEHVFYTQLGIAEPVLIDYLATLLTRFVRFDVLCRLRIPDEKYLVHTQQVLNEARASVGEAQRRRYQHIGDFALFWGGVYPEALEKAQPVVDRGLFTRLGKYAYHMASTIAADGSETSDEVLVQLSLRYDFCSYGLREVREAWEHDTTAYRSTL